MPGPRPGFAGTVAPVGGAAGRSGAEASGGAASSSAGAGGGESAGAGGSEISAGAGGGDVAGAGGADPLGGAGGTSDAGGASGASGAEGALPEADEASINAFLQARGYATWPSSSKPHTSVTPHGGEVRSFLNPVLVESLAAGKFVHPVGAAAVMELSSGGVLKGFVYSTKVAKDSAYGHGWYWYQIYSAQPSDTGFFAGPGVSQCTSCHGFSGRDCVLSEYPLP